MHKDQYQKVAKAAPFIQYQPLSKKKQIRCVTYYAVAYWPSEVINLKRELQRGFKEACSHVQKWWDI